MNPGLAQRLSPVDLALVALYLVAITIFGLTFAKRGKQTNSLKGYFLADNSIPWGAIALSIVSAETSTLTIISIPGVAFAGDLGFLQVVLGYMAGRVVVAFLFLPKYFRGEMLTAYQLIDRRFGPVLHKVTAGLFLLTRAAAEGVRVFAISIVVSIAIGTGDVLSIAIITALTLLYTFDGGMAAVIWTDVVQMALYVAGTVVALFTLGAHVPGGWGHIYAVAAPLGKFHMFSFALNLTESYTFWAGLLGGTFLTMASHGTDQLMVQRMLAARNLGESRLALLSSGVVIFFQFSLFLLIGVGLFVFYGLHPQVFATPDRIFPSFIVQQMPRGIAGLLVAAILAAAMSNLSAALNSLSSTTVIDFWVPLRRRRKLDAETGHRQNTLVSKLFTVVWALVLFLIAVYSIRHGGKGHVVETGLSIASVAYGSLLGVFLLGTLTERATEWGAIGGMVCGFALNVWLWQGRFPVEIAGLTVPHVAFTWFVLIGALATFGMGMLFSLLQRPGRRAAVAALVMFAMAGSSWGQAQPDFTPVSKLIEAAIAEKKLPGAVVVVGHGGKIVFEKAYGNRALEPKLEPMTEDTIFDMASLTKVLVTTTAVLQLYEAGKVDLDAPVAKYLPEFAQNGKDRITVRELMTHYSGLPEDVDLKDAWGLAKPDRAEGVRRAMAAVPYGPAGVTFKYSDINFITLGVLVEKLTNPQWNLFAERPTLDLYAALKIFNPLAMTETRFLSFDKVCGPVRQMPIPWRSLFLSLPVDGVADFEVDCDQTSWTASKWIQRAAPTAHDDQGSPANNSNFDHLLQAIVHDPTTRRMGGVAGHAGVFSTAADTAKFAQALLDKLLYDKGPFPLSQKTLKMATSPQEPAGAVKTATIFTPSGETTKGVASRGLGWDLNSPYSRPRGELFPIATREHMGSFGHTGFTGTSLWIDPVSNTYVILLSNAIHPRGAPPISALRGQVATAAAKALGVAQLADVRKIVFPPQMEVTTGGGGPYSENASAIASLESQPSSPKTLTGIDVLEKDSFAELKSLAESHGGHLKMAVLTNQSGIDSHSQRTIDILAKADPTLELTAIFTPEHGLSGRQDTEHLTAETDAATHLPVISLYGPKVSDKHPKQADLKKVDVVVIDLPDAGVRFWTYETVMGYFLEDCARAKVQVVVLDRPNPIGGVAAQGFTAEAGAESYIDFMPIPERHGMTMGELARFFNAQASTSGTYASAQDPEAIQMGSGAGASATGTNILPPAATVGLHAQLTVVPMQAWTRSEYFDDTGLPWVPPSPNMKTPATNIVYPAVALMETTNMSVGRGSVAPYENFGAPFVKAEELAAYLNVGQIPGVQFEATTLTIAEDGKVYPFHGQTIPGIHVVVTDRAKLDSPEMGVELLAALWHLYPAQFQLEKAKTIVLNKAVLESIRKGTDPREIAAGWAGSLKAFMIEREHYLMYR